MARVTVEDAVDQVGNRFDLILLAAKRARQLAIEGKDPLVDNVNDKPTVVALREIEKGLVTQESLEEAEVAEQVRAESAEFASVANILAE
ncbi:DNA-directed RNA polymerase subunit omega [Alteromonas sp. LMIT006]|jgi:DNA-directed RNA polymerase subunit omega|uniref:DNA-directed RNA polymerase subunit omega n=1 Tax=Alteromonadaceae TaxID=72275 RepID=UPI0019EA83D8|nr:DNA-directed RNA polymerase subunit omega [Alteromonas sp. LMIT006]MBE1287884.1 DNA-directed RNA polymerase subunit omega [Alteromonadaceae bacterium]UTP73348.1 DNA-directed RNA polymerase subunit omega [Alteromonas sp. LMIT006]